MAEQNVSLSNVGCCLIWYCFIYYFLFIHQDKPHEMNHQFISVVPNNPIKLNIFGFGNEETEHLKTLLIFEELGWTFCLLFL